MKTASPAMTAYLAALSATPSDLQVFSVDLYTITLTGGTVLRWCSGAQAITFGGHTFSVLSPSTLGVPAISRSKINSTVGLSVDKLKVSLYASPLALVNGISLLAALVRGDFDGATVLVQRLIMPTYGDISLGAITQFLGIVGDVTDIGSASALLSVNALTDLLNIDMPRNLYQPGCRHTLYDAGCTLIRASFQVSGTVAAGATVITIPTNLSQAGAIASPSAGPVLTQVTTAGVNLIPATLYVVLTYVGALGESAVSPEASLAVVAGKLLHVASPGSHAGVTGYNVYAGLQPGAWQLQNGTPIAIGTAWNEDPTGLSQGVPPPFLPAGGYFTQGVITFTSGPNNGVSRFVVGYAAGGTVTVLPGLPVAPANGNTFTIVPGCDKQALTCEKKFSNLINFGGQPFIPLPEATI